MSFGRLKSAQGLHSQAPEDLDRYPFSLRPTEAEEPISGGHQSAVFARWGRLMRGLVDSRISRTNAKPPITGPKISRASERTIASAELGQVDS